MTSTLPLAGVRVVDFTWVIAGPVSTKWLGAYGAEVIKIERYARGERVNRGAMSPDSVVSFNNINVNKSSLALDMRQPQAREVVRKLVAISDLVVDNFSPDVLPKWGFSYDELRAINPLIVSVSMPALGATGPHRNYRGLGSYFQARAALDGLIGYPHREIVDAGLAYADTTCNSAHATIAILAALRHQRVSGQGQHVELRQLESAINFLGPSLLQYTSGGGEPERMGSRSAFRSPHSVYRCAGDDEWCAITVAGDAQWHALCGAIGHPEWVNDPRFASVSGRKSNEAELDAGIQAWTESWAPVEVMETLQAAGVDAGAVQNIADMLERDPQVAHRGFYVRFAEDAVVESVPFKLSAVTPTIQREPPPLGADSIRVLRDLLSMPSNEVRELIEAGAVGVAE